MAGFFYVESLEPPEEEVPLGTDLLVLELGAPPESGPPYHVVQPGESLWTIARDRLGDAEYAVQLAELNGIDDPDEISVGQRIRLR